MRRFKLAQKGQIEPGDGDQHGRSRIMVKGGGVIKEGDLDTLGSLMKKDERDLDQVVSGSAGQRKSSRL